MLILGSKSKARYELLKLYNAEIEVRVADIDEVFDTNLSISDNVKKIAFDKAMKLLEDNDYIDDILICADTVVVVNDICLQKPLDYEDAFQMIKVLSNNKVEVITGVYLKNQDKEYNFSDSSLITFEAIDDKTIAKYLLENRDYLNISGALDIEKISNYLNYSIEGSHSNIIGLPLQKITELLYDGYSENNSVDIYRSSVRGIIFKEKKLALLKGYTFDKKHIFYHSIGGGYHNNEDKIEVLKKEAIEEGGLIIDNIEYITAIKEYNNSARNKRYNKMTYHSYYSADIVGHCDVNYIEYEIDLIIGVEYFTLTEAISIIEKQVVLFEGTEYAVSGMSTSDLQALKEFQRIQEL